MIEPDVVLMLPESYELPENVGLDALFMLDEPKTAKTLTQHELDILKKCIPTMKRSVASSPIPAPIKTSLTWQKKR